VVKIDGRAVHSILTGEKMLIDDYGFIFSKGNVASPGKECLIVPTQPRIKHKYKLIAFSAKPCST